MKNNLDRLRNAQMALRSVSLENSSLDNLILASLNPINSSLRERSDSLNQISHEHIGRKRAMTIDGPTKDKYTILGTSKNSAFSHFISKNQNEDIQSPPDAKMHLQTNSLVIKRKRTKLEMNKNFSPDN